MQPSNAEKDDDGFDIPPVNSINQFGHASGLVSRAPLARVGGVRR